MFLQSYFSNKETEKPPLIQSSDQLEPAVEHSRTRHQKHLKQTRNRKRHELNVLRGASRQKVGLMRETSMRSSVPFNMHQKGFADHRSLVSGPTFCRTAEEVHQSRKKEGNDDRETVEHVQRAAS